LLLKKRDRIIPCGANSLSELTKQVISSLK
jgi:hypothetical protein